MRKLRRWAKCLLVNDRAQSRLHALHHFSASDFVIRMCLDFIQLKKSLNKDQELTKILKKIICKSSTKPYPINLSEHILFNTQICKLPLSCSHTLHSTTARLNKIFSLRYKVVALGCLYFLVLFYFILSVNGRHMR